jgi:hypothetical protein
VDQKKKRKHDSTEPLSPLSTLSTSSTLSTFEDKKMETIAEKEVKSLGKKFRQTFKCCLCLESNQDVAFWPNCFHVVCAHCTLSTLAGFPCVPSAQAPSSIKLYDFWQLPIPHLASPESKLSCDVIVSLSNPFTLKGRKECPVCRSHPQHFWKHNIQPAYSLESFKEYLRPPRPCSFCQMDYQQESISNVFRHETQTCPSLQLWCPFDPTQKCMVTIRPFETLIKDPHVVSSADMADINRHQFHSTPDDNYAIGKIDFLPQLWIRMCLQAHVNEGCYPTCASCNTKMSIKEYVVHDLTLCKTKMHVRFLAQSLEDPLFLATVQHEALLEVLSAMQTNFPLQHRQIEDVDSTDPDTNDDIEMDELS